VLRAVFVFLSRACGEGCRRRECQRHQNVPHGYSIIMRSPCCGANR